MRIQHNISALNALRQLGSNNTQVSKNLEKLSSGYRINRAGDDAAGLAISEKMRGQIRGLDVAGQNAQDGISLIQTAEGSLQETHSILQRMRELSVQSSNGTYQNDVDRENLNKEMTSLKSEIDRIASSTHFNKINLLDGSLAKSDPSGKNAAAFSAVGFESTGAGAVGMTKVTGDAGLAVKFTTSSNGTSLTDFSSGFLNESAGLAGAMQVTGDAGLSIRFIAVAAGAGTASWSGNTVTLNMGIGVGASSNGPGINGMIAAATGTVAGNIQVNITGYLATSGVTDAVGTTINTKDSDTASWSGSTVTLVLDGTGANTYDTASINALIAGATGTKPTGADTLNVELTGDLTTKLATDATGTTITSGESTKAVIGATADEAFKINVTQAGSFGFGGDITFTAGGNGATNNGTNLAFTLTNTQDYSASDLTAMAKTAGVDGLSFDFKGVKTGAQVIAGYGTTVAFTDGTGDKGGKGISFQIGANGVDSQRVSLSVGDMSSKGLGIDGISIADEDSATAAIASMDNAINTLSATRADLGALQNRLEHTVNNVGTISENLTAAEARIRDVDMAKEMMEMTKNNILTQAAQAMLAQANQQPQSVLQLLQ